jgi:hypothetical protein
VSPDFSIRNEGSLFLVDLHTDAARCWVSENVSGEKSYWCGALVVEHRYVEHLVSGMCAAGLVQG